MNIVDFWLENDWVIKILVIALIVVFIIVLEKIYQFYKVSSAMRALKKMKTLDECKEMDKNVLSDILEDIVSFKNSDISLFNANIGVKLDIFEDKQMRFVGIISTIAILSPMIGLIGTFIGVWHVFADVGSVGLNDPAMMAKGIKEVLIDTMAGLVVAVVAMVFFKIFEFLAQRNIMMFENQLYKLLKT